MADRLTGAARRALGGALRADRLDAADEAISPPRDRPDQPLRRAVVADGGARRVDPARQGRKGNDSPAPHLVEQFGLTDHAPAVVDEIEQEIEDCGSIGTRSARRREFDPLLVEFRNEFRYRSGVILVPCLVWKSWPCIIYEIKATTRLVVCDATSRAFGEHRVGGIGNGKLGQAGRCRGLKSRVIRTQLFVVVSKRID